MAARQRKQQESGGSTGWARRESAGAIGAGVILLLAIIGGVLGWKLWGSSHVPQAQARLLPEYVNIPAPPPWIRSDIKAEVFRDGSLSELSVLDPELAKRVFHAFEMHPWVAKVHRISKRPPSQVIVDLHYRRPIAWVEVPEGMFPQRGAGVLPIDQDSVLLPQGDFTPEQLADFIRISVEGLSMCGPNGAVWGDPRVAGAAAIAVRLADHWQNLGLSRIHALPEYSQADARPRTRYELLTRQGKRLIWGSAPSEEQSGEPDASQKLQLLFEFVRRHGPLDADDQLLGLDLRDVNAALNPRLSQRP